MLTPTSKAILPTLLGMGGFVLLLNIVLYMERNSTDNSKTCLVRIDKHSELDFMVEFHSLKAHPLEKAQNHPLEKAQNAMAAPAKNASASRGLPVCPEQPPALGRALLKLSTVGSITVNVYKLVKLDDVVKDNPELKLGGFYSPPHCQPRDKVAIVIPFRDREAHLHIFLHYMIPILRRQLLQFKVFVIEQAGNCPINRAILRNIGAVEAAKESDWQCFCFHDVDMILENDRNLYTCPRSPKHLAVATDKFNYKLIYNTLFGGVVIFTKEQFWKVNGYSNLYFGWGGEDDDLFTRVNISGMKVIRPDASVARYKMIRGLHHTSDKANTSNNALLKEAKNRIITDGLNSLVYEISTEFTDLLVYDGIIPDLGTYMGLATPSCHSLEHALRAFI